MKQVTEPAEVADEEVADGTAGFTRRAGPRGRYAAAYREGHQRTVTVRVAPKIFQAMTPAGALTEADAVARSGRVNVLERTITVQYVPDAQAPAWRVGFQLQTRNSVHEGDLYVLILSS